MEERENPRQIWERRYSRMRAADVRPNADPWLERWLPQLAAAQDVPVLELGCGSGQDTRYLVDHGFRVIAGDYSRSALTTARASAAQAAFMQFDLRDGLPFPRETFPVIIAGLCLHYFSRVETQRIVAEIRDRLCPGGYLLVRVNSVRDVHYGAVGYAEIELGSYLVNGALKHFFDADDLRALFADGWRLHHLEERTIHRYENPKVVWEMVMEKNGRA
jgi:SAM-dependent methyltransferase